MFKPFAANRRRITDQVWAAEAQKAQNRVTFLMNFSDELRRKVPIGK